MPLLREDVLIGVLVLDSPLSGRFDDDDRAGIERLAASYCRQPAG